MIYWLSKSAVTDLPHTVLPFCCFVYFAVQCPVEIKLDYQIIRQTMSKAKAPDRRESASNSDSIIEILDDCSDSNDSATANNVRETRSTNKKTSLATSLATVRTLPTLIVYTNPPLPYRGK